MNKLDRLLKLKEAITLCDDFPDEYQMGEKEIKEYQSLKSEIQQAIEKADKWDAIQKSHEGISIFDLTEGYDRYKELEKIGYGGVSKKLKEQEQQIKQLQEEKEDCD